MERIQTQFNPKKAWWLNRMKEVVLREDPLHGEIDGDQVTAERMVQYLHRRGVQVLDPHNYPEGVKLLVRHRHGDALFRGGDLEGSLMRAVLWTHGVEAPDEF